MSSTYRLHSWLSPLLVIVVLALTACADWRANFWADPPGIKVVAWTPTLTTLAEEADKKPFDYYFDFNHERAMKEEWAKGLKETFHHLTGWKLDLCSVITAKKEREQVFPALQGIDVNNYQLFLSWVRRIHPGMKRAEEGNTDNALIEVLKLVTSSLPPSIDGLTEAHVIKYEQEVCANPDRKKKAEYMSEHDFSVLLQDKLWRRVDRDHHGLILSDDEAKKYQRGRDDSEWAQLYAYRHGLIFKSRERDLTVSKSRMAALTLSVRKVDESEADKKPPLVFDLKEKGQKALVEFARDLAEEPDRNCADESTRVACKETIGKARQDLLGMLRPPKTQPSGARSFNPKQKIELQVSSAVNSPDITSRFDYIATYVYLYPYPLPTNGPVSLAEEFWDIFGARHLARPLHEQNMSRNLAADFEAAWYDLRVRVENVQTTVTTTQLQEIAKITKESVSSAELNKLSPSAEYAGVKGSLSVEGALGSNIKTKVEETLVKQLDHRSVWISSARDLLRITQRGTDAINPAGMIREEVTLNVPSSLHPIYLLTIEKGQLKLDQALTQPVYQRVHGLAVSVGVIREPYEFKRSAVEKFGLPDSADAYWTVQVSNPVYLDLWDWYRTLDALTVDELLMDPPKPGAPRHIEEVMFHSPSLSYRGPVTIDPRESEEFRRRLKAGIVTLANSKASPVCTPGKSEDLCVSVAEDPNNKGKRFFLVANAGTGTVGKTEVGQLWLGKRDKKGEKLNGYFYSFDCGDIPVLDTYLRNNNLCP